MMITCSDIKYLKLAETMSGYSDYKKIHIGACVVKKKSVISTGCNKNKTHPIQEKYNNVFPFERKPRLHAEMDALIKASSDAKDSTLYVYRKRRDGLPGMSKPCEACMNFIREIGVKRVVYTIDNGIQEIII